MAKNEQSLTAEVSAPLPSTALKIVQSRHGRSKQSTTNSETLADPLPEEKLQAPVRESVAAPRPTRKPTRTPKKHDKSPMVGHSTRIRHSQQQHLKAISRRREKEGIEPHSITDLTELAYELLFEQLGEPLP